MDRRTRASLAQAAAQGDTHAFSQLYGQIYRQLYYYALSNLRSSHDAADAVQDAVLEAFRGIGGLRDPGAFDRWMFTILTAVIKRKQKEYSEEKDRLGPLPADPAAIITERDPGERYEILEELSGLSEAERLCITLHSIAGYSTREVAQMTELAPSTVRSYISRGRKQLRKGLSLSEKKERR